jgi:hemoglobin/transferrin/lactoferrin receptor protein
VDDLAKVFESATGRLVVPNPDLKPEYTYNADLSLSYVASDVLKVEATGFYTSFRDALIADKFTLNGQDSVNYNGGTSAVVALQNKASAYVLGFTSSLTARLMPDVTLFATLTHTYGRYKDAEDNEVPLDHIPPTYGKVSLRYAPASYYLEAFTIFNSWKKAKDYNPFGEDNAQYATEFGMPAWATINVRAGYFFRSHLSLEAGVENLLDTHYRTFASGISSPGRNLVLTLRGRF